jgi:hypothetical protein
MDLYISKNVPELSYSLQSRTNLANDVWQNLAPSTDETDTAWSAHVPFAPEQERIFFQVITTPLPGMSPPWPTDGGLGF